MSTYDQKAAVAHWDCGYDQGLGTLQECAVHKLRERERRRAALLPRSAAPPAKAARNWRAQRREPPCVRGRTSLSEKGVRCRIAVARAACVADTSGSGVHKGAQRALSERRVASDRFDMRSSRAGVCAPAEAAWNHPRMRPQTRAVVYS